MAGYEIRYNTSEDIPDVSFSTVNPQNAGNSGGGMTIVGNVYFSWDSADGGFTNTGWWGTEIETGPTYIGGFRSDDAVKEYLRNPGNSLNTAFAEWQSYIDKLESWRQPIVVGDFTEALALNGGSSCMS